MLDDTARHQHQAAGCGYRAVGDTEDELALLAEIEDATSGRLIVEERGRGGLAAAEFAYGVPYA